MKKILLTTLLTIGFITTGNAVFAANQTYDFGTPGDYTESNSFSTNITGGVAEMELGSFTANDIAGDTGSSIGATTADFNNDGNTDIYMTQSGQNKVWLGDGLGGFTANDITGDTNFSYGGTTADFNNDGNADMYVPIVGATAQNKVWLGDGLGGFTANDIASDTGFSNRATTADFNNDGNADIFLADNNLSRVHIGNGLGGFTTTNIPVGNSAQDAISADFDNDGNIDVYIPKGINQQNKLFLGNGLGGFTANDIALDLGTSTGATTADFNNDGNADIYVANSAQNKVWLGDGFGGFTANDITGDVDSSNNAISADFNNDGNADIYVANASNQQNKLYLGDGFGGFTSNDIVGDLAISEGVTSADFNNDGNADIYVANSTQNKVYINGFSTTAPSVELNTPFVFTTPILGFSETLGGNNQGSIAYQVSLDAGVTWQYYDGAAWVATVLTDGTEANTAAELNTNLSTLAASGSIIWRAYMISNGSEQVELDEVFISESVIVVVTPSTSSSSSTRSGTRRISKERLAELFGKTTVTEDMPVETIDAPTDVQCSITYTRLIKRGMRGNDIMQVQTCMNSLGHTSGPADGMYGPLTMAGIIAYQKENNLLVDGIVGPQTVGELNSISNIENEG